MESLIGLDRTSGISPVPCALGRRRADHETGDTGCEMRLFAPGSGCAECESDLPADGIARKRRDRIVQMRVSGSNSSTVRSLLRGLCDARRHCAVLLSGLLSQSKSGPLLQNARLGAWESRPLAWLRPV